MAALPLLVGVGCTPFNRMTSPEVLPKEQRTWTVAAAVDPFALAGGSIIGVQPVIGYRAGLGAGQELGITIYGIFFPAMVLDHKHQFLKKNDFFLAGDFAGYAGVSRPVGLQYDLLFGNRKLYGVGGFNYHFYHEFASKYGWTAGIGAEFSEKFGLQLSYSHGLPRFVARSEDDEFHGTESMVTVGLKFSFTRDKKKYRTK